MKQQHPDKILQCVFGYHERVMSKNITFEIPDYYPPNADRTYTQHWRTTFSICKHCGKLERRYPSKIIESVAIHFKTGQTSFKIAAGEWKILHTWLTPHAPDNEFWSDYKEEQIGTMLPKNNYTT